MQQQLLWSVCFLSLPLYSACCCHWNVLTTIFLHLPLQPATHSPSPLLGVSFFLSFFQHLSLSPPVPAGWWDASPHPTGKAICTGFIALETKYTSEPLDTAKCTRQVINCHQEANYTLPCINSAFFFSSLLFSFFFPYLSSLLFSWFFFFSILIVSPGWRSLHHSLDIATKMLLNDSTHKIMFPLPSCIFSSHLSSLYSLRLSRCHFYCSFFSFSLSLHTDIFSPLLPPLSYPLPFLPPGWKWEATSRLLHWIYCFLLLLRPPPLSLLQTSCEFPAQFLSLCVSCNWKLEMTQSLHDDGHRNTGLSPSRQVTQRNVKWLQLSFTRAHFHLTVRVTFWLQWWPTHESPLLSVISLVVNLYIEMTRCSLSLCLSFNSLSMSFGYLFYLFLRHSKHMRQVSECANAFTVHLLIKLPLCLPLEQCIRQIYCMCTVARASRQARCVM